MHIPDGFVSGPINVVGGLAAVTAVGVSAWRASRETEKRPHTMPLLATTGAFVFAAQMLNFPIGGGTSGHFMGGAVVAALLGPWSACLVLSLVLMIQCFGFADGGLTALGTNIFNMGIVGGFGSYFVMRGLRALLPAGRGGYLGAVALASWICIVLASAACALELAFSGTSPLGLVLPAMVGTHAVIGIGEALITVAVLSAIMATRPDVLPDWAQVETLTADSASESLHGKKKKGAWALAAGGLVVAIVLGVCVSPFASSSPDGLEKVAEKQGFIEASEEKAVWMAAPLPDYAVPSIEDEKQSTGVAGLLGTASVFLVGFGMIKLLHFRPKSQGT